MPKLIVYQSQMSPPRQGPIVVGDVTVMQPPDPQPTPKVVRPGAQEIFMPLVTSVAPPFATILELNPKTEVPKPQHRRQVFSEIAQPPSPLAAIPLARAQPNEMPTPAKRFAQTDPAGVVNPVPYAPSVPASGLPEVWRRKPSFPDDGSFSPPLLGSTMTRMELWVTQQAQTSAPRRFAQTDIGHVPPFTVFGLLSASQKLPEMLLGQVPRILRQVEYPAHYGPVRFADIPTIINGNFRPPDNGDPIRRRVQTENIVNLLPVITPFPIPTNVEQWGTPQAIPRVPRPNPPQQTEAQPPAPSTIRAPLMLGGIEQPWQFRRPAMDTTAALIGPPAGLAIPFIDQGVIQPQVIVRRVDWLQAMYPLAIKDAPRGMNYTLLPDEWAKCSRSAWRQDWTVAVPWTTIIGLPDPSACFDQIRLTSTPSPMAHATNLNIGSVTTIPGLFRLDGETLDLSNAVVTLTFTRPDGTGFTRTPTIYNAPGGRVYYTTTAADFDVTGRWKHQWVVVIGTTTYTDLATEFLVQSTVKPFRRAYPFDLGQDWKYIDGLEPLRIVNPDTSSVCVEFALRREARETLSTFSESEISVTTCRWHVWKEHLGSFVPEPHGFAVDQYGSEWFITAVDLQTGRTRYIITTVLQSGKGVR